MKIDRERIARLFGDEMLVERFIRVFEMESKQLLIGLQQQYATGDWIALSRSAHSLKNHLNYAGDTELGKLCEEIENMAQPPVNEILLKHKLDELLSQTSQLR